MQSLTASTHFHKLRPVQRCRISKLELAFVAGNVSNMRRVGKAPLESSNAVECGRLYDLQPIRRSENAAPAAPIASRAAPSFQACSSAHASALQLVALQSNAPCAP